MPSRTRYVASGIFGGLLGAALVAGFAGALSHALAGAGQEVFNAAELAPPPAGPNLRLAMN